MEVALRGVRKSDLKGSIAVTGFRGFGMVGYMTSKHLALALKADKIGYILIESMPPFVTIEEDGVGYPFEVYYLRKPKTLIIVNRAVPERDSIEEYTRGLAEWMGELDLKFSILVGGLSRDFMPPGDPHGYRWLKNRFYEGPLLEAPQLEYGLGVMGPLALLYMYLDYFEVPAAMVLPYSLVEGVDYDAVLLGVKVIADKMLEAEVSLADLEALARTQRAEIERMLRILEQERREEREAKGIYM